MNAIDQLDLTPIQRAILADILAAHASHFSAVIAFGSRAMGTARPGSDLDLAVIDPLPDARELLWSALAESALPFFSDVLILDKTTDESLSAEIRTHGIVLSGAIPS
jgi:predicted nucleotidyltransferase